MSGLLLAVNAYGWAFNVLILSGEGIRFWLCDSMDRPRTQLDFTMDFKASLLIVQLHNYLINEQFLRGHTWVRSLRVCR